MKVTSYWVGFWVMPSPAENFRVGPTIIGLGKKEARFTCSKLWSWDLFLVYPSSSSVWKTAQYDQIGLIWPVKPQC